MKTLEKQTYVLKILGTTKSEMSPGKRAEYSLFIRLLKFCPSALKLSSGKELKITIFLVSYVFYWTSLRSFD